VSVRAVDCWTPPHSNADRASFRTLHGKPGLALESSRSTIETKVAPVTQPEPRPKTFYEKTVPELQDELVKRISHGNYDFSPNNYADQIAYLQGKQHNDRANRIASRLIWATWAAAAAATMSAISTAFTAFGHHEAPPPSPVVITQTALPPAPVTITETVLPPPAPSHP
jgi:hypothetical protein